MSGKKARYLPSTEKPAVDEDKENRKVLANLKFNNLNKNLEDAHLFKLSKKNLMSDRERPSEVERDSRTTNSRSYRNLGKSQTAMLMELLKSEIEKKFAESDTNKHYRFPRRIKGRDDSEESIQSLEDADTYNLFAQNQSENTGVQEIENLLSRLVTIVNKTPHGGSLINQKNTNSHRLFCQLLQNVACDKEDAPTKIIKQKKTKEKSLAKNEQLKLITSVTKSVKGPLIGKLHLKSKQELGGTLKSNRTEVSPPLKREVSRECLKSFARDISKHYGPQKDLARSGSGKLIEKRIENPPRNRISSKPVKTFVAASFGNSGLKKSSSNHSRRQSPEDSSVIKLQIQGPHTKSFAKLTKKLASNAKLRVTPTGHLL
jgi:hypothetical protein